METKKASPPRQHGKSHPTLLSNIISTIIILVLLSIISWFFLLGWFGIEVIFSVNNNANSLIQEILTGQFNFINSYNPKILEMILDNLKHIEYIFYLEFNYSINGTTSTSLTNILYGTFEIIVSRICVFLMSIPFLVVILGIYIIDGLVQRDIRKFRGERESTLFFHRSRLLLNRLFNLIFFIFMAMPFAVSPQFILIPMGFLCGLIAMISIKHFKKYV
jgi:hypothetical protein